MNIAIIGYGKMGKMVEAAATQAGHTIVAIIDGHLDDAALQLLKASGAEVAIEFTQPDAVLSNIQKCLEIQLPLVVGTTGWYEQVEDVKQWVDKAGGSVLYASNFSFGVNLLFALNRKLGEWIGSVKDYRPYVYESHHTEKKDAPSGTAHTLIQAVMQAQQPSLQEMALQEGRPVANSSNELQSALPVYYERLLDVKGYHEVVYHSSQDQILISHEAFTREGFAQGAIRAAEFLKGKKGLFSQDDLYHFV